MIDSDSEASCAPVPKVIPNSRFNASQIAFRSQSCNTKKRKYNDSNIGKHEPREQETKELFTIDNISDERISMLESSSPIKKIHLPQSQISLKPLNHDNLTLDIPESSDENSFTALSPLSAEAMARLSSPKPVVEVRSTDLMDKLIEQYEKKMHKPQSQLSKTDELLNFSNKNINFDPLVFSWSAENQLKPSVVPYQSNIKLPLETRFGFGWFPRDDFDEDEYLISDIPD